MDLELLAPDLTPGDRKSTERDWSDVQLRLIKGIHDPFFDVAFLRLWEEFHPHGEMETADILAKRLQWNPATLINGCAMLYQMILVTSKETVAAVRDHTAIVLPDRREAIVHLSHALVMPEWRRTGIAGWMRAFPIQTARHALRAQNLPENSPITLVGEMEKPDANDPKTTVRLKAYEKAGYRKIDPAAVHYLQPDFRAPEIIDSTGGPQPVPMTLIVRRVGHEEENSLSGREVRNIVDALYRMYGTAFRAKDMQAVHDSLLKYPCDTATIALLPPTAT